VFAPEKHYFSAEYDTGAFGANFEVADLTLDLPPIPLRVKMSSADPSCGDFSCLAEITAFSAKVFKSNEQQWTLSLPCGKEVLFSPLANSTMWKSTDQVWTAKVQPETRTFEIWTETGWRSVYKDGRIANLKFPAGRTIVWNYDENGIRSLTDHETGKLLCSVLHKGNSIFVSTESRETYTFSHPHRGIFAIHDRGMESLVSQFRLQLDEASRTQTLRQVHPVKAFHTWDADSGVLKKTDLAVYSIELRDDNYPIIKLSSERFGEASRNMDIKKGVLEISSRSQASRTTYQSAPGPLYYKPRLVETTKGGKATWKKYFYSQKGEKIRTELSSGSVYSYVYTEEGTSVEKRKQDAFLWSKTYDEKGRILSWVSGPKTYHFNYLDEDLVEVTQGEEILVRPLAEIQKLSRWGSLTSKP